MKTATLPSETSLRSMSCTHYFLQQPGQVLLN